MWHLINHESKLLLSLCRKFSLKISTAESCTGGLISSSIISNDGSSQIYERGFITYSNESKILDLNVNKNIIMSFGSVSKETAEQMLIGLLKKTNSSLGVSITGIAGPKGGSKIKPIGTVWISFGGIKKFTSKKFNFDGNRLEIRLASVLNSLKLINNYIKDNYP